MRGGVQWQARINRKGFREQVKIFVTCADAEVWACQIESKIDRGVFDVREDTVTQAFDHALK